MEDKDNKQGAGSGSKASSGEETEEVCAYHVAGASPIATSKNPAGVIRPKRGSPGNTQSTTKSTEVDTIKSTASAAAVYSP